MPASVIDRFSNNQGHNGVFAGPVVTATLPNRRNEALERISRQARRLRGGQFMGASGHVLNSVANGDSFEGVLTRMGIIPIVVIPNATSLTGTIQAYPGRRPATSENISVLGAAAGTSFVVGDPAKSVAFSAGGTKQVLTATDSVDASAKGRALVDILP
jgi:hypothetical protein